MPDISDIVRHRFGKVLPLFAFAVAIHATAADAANGSPSQATYVVSGNVGKRCTVVPASVAVTHQRNGSNTATTVAGVTGTSTTVTVRCNAATGGTLSVLATNLTSGVQNPQSYTVTVTGWGTAITYTAGNATAGTRSNAATVATVTVAVSNIPAASNFANNTPYNSTITLSISAN